MGKTALELTTDEWRLYQPARAVLNRKLDHQEKILIRRKLAWQIARKAADLIKTDFGARKVVVFGSLVHDDAFTPWSDIDIAVWGIHPSHFYMAVAALIDLSPEIDIDLVDPADCSYSLQETIRHEGIEL